MTQQQQEGLESSTPVHAASAVTDPNGSATGAGPITSATGAGPITSATAAAPNGSTGTAPTGNGATGNGATGNGATGNGATGNGATGTAATGTTAPTGTPAAAVPTGLAHPELDKLIAVLELLRAPGGCAWDAEQTHESLVRYLIEETYELVDAIESGDRDEMIEELGDVLYQVIFHSDIAAATPGEAFTLEDVAAHMTAKMVGRHPHVFGEDFARSATDTAADVNKRWDELKKVEKPGRKSVLDGVPQAMPSLLLADKLLAKAAKLDVNVDAADVASFDWTAFDSEEALGAALLATVATAQASGLDAERALRGALRDLQDRMRAAEAS